MCLLLGIEGDFLCLPFLPLIDVMACMHFRRFHGFVGRPNVQSTYLKAVAPSVTGIGKTPPIFAGILQVDDCLQKSVAVVKQIIIEIGVQRSVAHFAMHCQKTKRTFADDAQAAKSALGPCWKAVRLAYETIGEAPEDNLGVKLD